MKTEPVKYESPEKYGDRYGVKADTIRKWCRAGKVPGAIKVGSQWRIPAPEVKRKSSLDLFPDTADFSPETAVEWFDDRWYKVPLENGGYDFYPSVTTVLDVMHPRHLRRWRGDLGNELADSRLMEAANKGSRIHHACSVAATRGIVLLDNTYKSRFDRVTIQEYHDKSNGNLFILRDQAEYLQVMRFTQWLNAVQPKILGVEMTVFSHEYRIAGTLDYLMEIRGGVYPVQNGKDIIIPAGVYVFDLKTGKYEDLDKHPMQVSAYVKCAKEPSQFNPIANLEIKGGIVLYTNAPKHYTVDDDDFTGGMKTILLREQAVEDNFADYLHSHALWWRNNSRSVPRIFDLPYILDMTNNNYEGIQDGNHS